MNSRFRLKPRLGDGKWVNSTPILSEGGNQYTVLIDRLNASANILNSSGTVVATISSSGTLPALEEALRNFLIDKLNCRYAMDLTSHNAKISVTDGRATSVILTFSAVPTSGNFKVNYNTNSTASILSSDSNTNVTTKLHAVTGLENVSATGNYTSGFTLDVTNINEDPSNLSVSNNTLMIMREQTITLSDVPDEGSYSLKYNSVAIATINFDDDAAAIQTKMRLTPALSGVLVTGDSTAGFLVKFPNMASPAALSSASDTLKASSVAVTITIATTVAYSAVTITVA